MPLYLCSLHQDLSLLLFFPLLLHLVQVLKELELGPRIASLLVPTILLPKHRTMLSLSAVGYKTL